MRALSLEEVNAIITASFAEAKRRKCRPMSAIVLDAGGRVKAFQKQDGASMLRFEICYGKAYGSLALGRASKLVLQKAREKPLFMQSIENLADYPLFLEGGGQLIRDKFGEVLGAVGVTGDANELDDICAIAGHSCGQTPYRQRLLRRSGRDAGLEHPQIGAAGRSAPQRAGASRYAGHSAGGQWIGPPVGCAKRQIRAVIFGEGPPYGRRFETKSENRGNK